MANGRVVVPPPAFTPLSHGLLVAAQDMTPQFNSHWEAGIIWMPLCSSPDSTYDECLTVTGVGATPQPETKSASFTNVRRAATPFTVYARKDCSTPTYWDDLPEQMREAIFQGEAWQVERSFWTGIAAGTGNIVHPHLANENEMIGDRDQLEIDMDILADDPVNIVVAVGLLDEALADCYKGRGVLHAPAGLAAHLKSWGLICRLDDGTLVSPAGNLWAIGAGYDGSSPDTPGTVTEDVRWIYGTGAAFFARGEVRDFTRTEMLDRTDNTLEGLTERTYIVGWDCCLLGVPVDITSISGSVGGGDASAANQVTGNNFLDSIDDGVDLLVAGGVPAGTVLYAEIDRATSGAVVAAAGSGNKIRVLSYVLVAASAVTVEWRSASTGISGAMSLSASGGVSSGYSPVGHFQTAANEALNIQLGSGVQVSGHVAYCVTT